MRPLVSQSVRTTSASKPAPKSVTRGPFWRVGGPVAELPLFKCCRAAANCGALRTGQPMGLSADSWKSSTNGLLM